MIHVEAQFAPIRTNSVVRAFWRAAATALLVAVANLSAAAPGLSKDGDDVLQWIVRSADNQAAPFAIIDKRRAQLWLFDAQGQWIDSSPVLLGSARGDESVPGIGERDLKDILSHERTTPAGRFVVEPGRNTKGEDIFWIDYDAAVSMHRVRTHKPAEKRLKRLASATAEDNRISYGCINVPVAFYEQRIDPLFKPGPGLVYLLPEKKPLTTVFPAVHWSAGQQAAR